MPEHHEVICSGLHWQLPTTRGATNGSWTPGDGCTGQGSTAESQSRRIAAPGSDEGRHGSQDRTQISRPGATAQRSPDGARLANAGGSARRRLAEPGGVVAARADVTGQNAAGVAAAGTAGPGL